MGTYHDGLWGRHKGAGAIECDAEGGDGGGEGDEGEGEGGDDMHDLSSWCPCNCFCEI